MKIRVFVSGLLVAGVSLCLMAAVASATTLTVTTTTDPNNTTGSCASGGSCSLRQAVNRADADGGGDTITVPASTTPYTLKQALGALTFTADATLTGAGATSTLITGGTHTQILDITSGSVTVQGVTLEHGNASGDRGGAARIDGGASLTLDGDKVTSNTAPNGGGGIEDGGTLSVTNSSITSNTTPGSGGGIEVIPGTSTTMASASVVNSTISGNTAQSGGGLREGGGTGTSTVAVTIDHSTFSGNTATAGNGGGVRDPGSASATMSVSNSTFFQNSALDPGGGLSIGNGPNAEPLINDTIVGNVVTGVGQSGGDINVGGGAKPQFTNTIVAAGVASSGPDCNGTVTSNGHNLDDQNGCGFTAAGDLVNTTPRLGGLAGNGGPTQTMALQAGSPAIDAGTNTGCPGTDQRGVTRPQESACDIGAYEVAPPSASTGAATNLSTTAATMNATASNPDAVGGTVAFQYGTTTSYGSTTTAQSIPVETSSAAFSAALSSLQPNTTYHYRVVVTNPDGTATGPDQAFTTTTTPPPTPPSNKYGVGRRHVSKTGKVTIKLTAPDAGAFKGKATFKAHHKKFVYGTGSTSVGGAGSVVLTIKLKHHARAELLKLGHARVSIVITFSPTGGTPAAKKITLKVKVRHGHFRL